MGRRKQTNPTKLEDDYTTEASTSKTAKQPATNGHSNGKSSDKKLNFSISAHLQADTVDKVHKSANEPNSVSYNAAQKAYQTLMSNLKQQENLMKSMGFGNNSAASFFMNPFFAAGMPSFDFFSGYQNSTPKKRHKLGKYKLTFNIFGCFIIEHFRYFQTLTTNEHAFFVFLAFGGQKFPGNSEPRYKALGMHFVFD
jgi:hypothetical protein